MSMALPARKSVLTRRYGEFSGVDFTSAPASTALNRSPDAKNVYRDYAASGNAIVSRRGIRALFTNESSQAVGRLNSMISFDGNMYIHFGSMLLRYTTFPEAAYFRLPFEGGSSGVTPVNGGLNPNYSRFFVFRNHLYAIDGRGYSRLNDSGLFNQYSTIAFVPTTMISGGADGGGVKYQAANLLTPYRINTFIGDGTSRTFYLDCQNIASGSVSVQVNGLTITSTTIDYISAAVTFASPPPAPTGSGADNIQIRFSTGIDESAKITKCTLACVFDNRVFLSGNPDYPGVIFHSEFEDGTYFGELNYYDDGEDQVAIKGLLASEGVLIVVKADGGDGSKVYLHSPSLDHELGKVYPAIATSISLGAAGDAMIFNDDIVFLSPMGLEALSVSSSGRAALAHRSYFIDRKLLSGAQAAAELASARMCRWRNYLVLLCGNTLYLADSRQTANVAGSTQYEWYCFEDMLAEGETAVSIGEHEGDLYLLSDKGTLYVFDSDTDDGRQVESYWSTPPDDFGSSAYLKSTNIHGAAVVVRRIHKGRMKLSVSTDRESDEVLREVSTAPFSFAAVDFSMHCFDADKLGTIIFRPRKKRFKNMRLCFRSESAAHPLGLIGCDIEVTIDKYTR